MRKILVSSLVVAPALLGVVLAARAGEPAARVRKVKLTCKLNFPEHKAGKALEAWIPLPPALGEVQSAPQGLEGKAEPGSCEWLDGKGQPREFAHATIPATEKPIEIRWTATVERREHRASPEALKSTATGLTDKERADLAPYLRSELANPLDEGFQKTASGLAPGEKATIKVARAVYDYTLANMKYDKPRDKPGWGKGSLSWACSAGFGNCTDFHALFMNLCRARGIPARFTMGFSLPKEKKGDVAGYHCWCEFYVSGAGWVPVDVSEAWKHAEKRDYYFGALDEDRVTLVRGRDLVLDPKQKGEPVSIVSIAYAEEEGRPVPCTRELSYEDVESK
ncbi:transglutaminase domain-containing protein [bacterium]|nr:transglutaminase domain-containing protein [bacterium]